LSGLKQKIATEAAIETPVAPHMGTLLFVHYCLKLVTVEDTEQVNLSLLVRYLYLNKIFSEGVRERIL